MALALQPRGRNLLGLAEAAALAGVHRNTVRAWCASGRLPSVKVNARGDRRVRREDVERLVAARASADPHVPRSRPSRGSPTRLAVVREQLRRGDVLRRIASEISGQLDLPQMFEEVIDESFALFGVDRAGLWLYEDRPQPLTFAAQRGLSNEMLVEIEKLPRDAPTAGMSAMRDREVHVLEGTLEGTTPALRETYVRHGIRTICFVPVAFRDEPLGLLALYHHRRYDWTSDETGLARAFADHMATAIGTARLFESSRALADRLRVISDLAVRLNRIQDLEGIGQTIVSSARRVIQHDTIRVYRVDHASATCEPIAFEGRFRGIRDASVDSLRVKVGTGLTGWCAANNEPIRIGDARADPRSVIVGDTEEPESMLLVPMTYEEVVRGVIVVSKVGLERFTADDETALSIFAGYAAQALVNADNLERLHRQQAEREHQLASQRRLLEINERLLSTLDPSGVLDLIADSLKTIVPYDSLTVYRSDPARGVRRAVIARDRFADLILADEAPLRAGVTGWVIEHSEAVMANDAHLDPRSVQVPGTPFEPESIVVVPLLVNGEVIGTLNVGRVGGVEAHFDGNEFELVKLFAGQASIALQNAETHGEVRVRADHDALTGLRNHGAFQRELGAAVAAADGSPLAVLMLDLDGFKAYNDTLGHPAGDALLAEAAAAMSGVLRDGDRLYRYGGDEFAVVVAGAGRAVAYDVAARLRTAVAGLRDPGRGPRVSITAGIASYPEDGRTKDQLVAAADRALYHAKPGRRGPPARGTPEDPYLRALDETAIALVERRDPASLVETIMSRAAALVGTPHAFLCLVEPDSDEIVVQHGAGSFADIVGQRFGLAEGLAGEVVRTGQPLAIDDYDTYAGRSELPQGRFGAVVGVPLTSAGKVLGVLGLGAGDIERTFGPAEIDALTRFAKLASIALDNARLFDAAQRVALYDTTTGLPNRELLMDRIGQALARTGPEAGGAIGVLLLDLDRFKVINESVGHAVGDRLLDAVGQR
ncbi:MAG: GAF domain-containing protein, partial [Chloroflexota bacterium]